MRKFNWTIAIILTILFIVVWNGYQYYQDKKDAQIEREVRYNLFNASDVCKNFSNTERYSSCVEKAQSEWDRLSSSLERREEGLYVYNPIEWIAEFAISFVLAVFFAYAFKHLQY